MENWFEQPYNAENSTELKKEEIERQKEIIKEVAEKMKEECNYEDLDSFIDYLKDLYFLLAEFSDEKDREKFKEEYIKSEINLFSIQANIDPQVFNKVYDVFITNVSLESIKAIEEELNREYLNKEYKELISHIGKICEVFVKNKNSDIKELRKDIIEEKIEELASGEESIKQELYKLVEKFNKKLKENNILKQN